MGMANDERVIAICKYMDLRINGFGVGLSDKEIKMLQSMTPEEDDALFKTIIDLGGTLPKGLKTSQNPSKESLAFSAVLKGIWIHGHKWAVEQVRKTLSEAEE